MTRLRIGSALVPLLLASPAAAVSTLYGDLASFLADTGAVGTAIPDAGGSGTVTSPQTVGPLTFALGPGATTLVFGGTTDWTARLAGAELALSGVEDLDVTIASDVFAFGFEFVEPEFDPNVNVAFVDSTFSITLLDDGGLVESFQFSPANDVATFFAVWSSAAFDAVEIRETLGSNDNEFFGTFYTGSQPLPTPEPPGLVLGALALLAVHGVSRRIRIRPIG